MYKFIGVVAILLLGMGISGCGRGNNDRELADAKVEVPADVADSTSDSIDDVAIQRSLPLFGVETEGRTDMEVLLELRSMGIVQFDDSVSDLPFVLEFAGVPFGLNADKGHGRGFNFITSQHDAKTVKRLVKEISKYYGEPGIDGDQEEPEYCYYGWNTWNPDYPTVRIRPVHKDDGGLTMFWNF